MQNYYSILNLEKFSSAELVKKQYRVLVKQYHPDVNPNEDANSRFLAIQEAYECLINPHRKREYDNFLKGKPTSQFSSASKQGKEEELPKKPVKHYKRCISNIRDKIRDIEFFNLYNLKTELDKILNERQVKHLYNNSSIEERVDIFNELLPFIETLNEYPVFGDYIKILEQLAGSNGELRERLQKFDKAHNKRYTVPKHVAVGCSGLTVGTLLVFIYVAFFFVAPSEDFEQSIIRDENTLSDINKQYIAALSEYPNVQPFERELNFSTTFFNNKLQSCYSYPLVGENYCRRTGWSINNETEENYYDLASSNTIVIENNYNLDMLFILEEANTGNVYRNELVLPGEKFALLYLPNKKFTWFARFGKLIEEIKNPTEDYSLKFKQPYYEKEYQDNNELKFTKKNKDKMYRINFAKQPKR